MLNQKLYSKLFCETSIKLKIIMFRTNYLSILFLITLIFINTKPINIFAKEINNLTSADAKAIEKLLIELKSAINKDDVEAVASMIDFPLYRLVLRNKEVILDKKDFLYNYKRIVTEQVKRAINEATLEDISYDPKYSFAMPGGIWFEDYSMFISPHIHPYKIKQWNEFKDWNEKCDCLCN